MPERKYSVASIGPRIDSFLRVARDSPLALAELRHLGGALARSPQGAGALGHFDGELLLYGAGVPGAPAPAAELNASLDRFAQRMESASDVSITPFSAGKAGHSSSTIWISEPSNR